MAASAMLATLRMLAAIHAGARPDFPERRRFVQKSRVRMTRGATRLGYGDRGHAEAWSQRRPTNVAPDGLLHASATVVLAPCGSTP